MTRTKLKNRILPEYTRGEEIFNFVSHIIGGVFGIFALISCIFVSIKNSNVWGLVSSCIYSSSMILLYTVSSVYHALNKNTGKKVMQVIDHCAIFILIAGTYTPILLCPIRVCSAVWCWSIFGFVWGCAILGIVFNAIDLKKYSTFSIICYIGMGWCIVTASKIALKALPLNALLWLLAGGIAYTVGAVFYGIGKKKKYIHSVFHVFVVMGSVFQYITIVCFCI